MTVTLIFTRDGRQVGHYLATVADSRELVRWLTEMIGAHVEFDPSGTMKFELRVEEA